MMRTFLPAAAGVMAFLAILPATQARAQAICGNRDQVVEHLRDRYGERVRSMGLAADSRIVEVFASDETGTWTIAVTSARGVTCLIASGRHFEAVTPGPEGAPL
jgi:hypothetical protein